MEEDQLPAPNVSEMSGQTQLESVSQTSPPPNVIKKTSKFSVKALIGTIIFLLLAGGAAASFTIFKPQIMKLVSKPTPTSTPKTDQTSPAPTPNHTADWKTLTNDFYHISLKAPKDWTIDGNKLISPNSQITINTDTRSLYTTSIQACTTTQDLGKTTVELGSFKASRSRILCKEGYISDFVKLNNTPLQKNLNFQLIINGDFNKNNPEVLAVLKTFQFTQKEPSIDSYVKYNIPIGWVIDNYYVEQAPSAFSVTLKPEDAGINYAAGGPDTFIGISRTDKLDSYPSENTNNISGRYTFIKTVDIGGAQWKNGIHCGELSGCSDEYALKKDNYVWRISFNCSDCQTSGIPSEVKAIIDKSKYAKDRDAFLASFEFKDSPTPTCMQRPACLDATPRCMIAEPANGWCP